MPNPLNTRLTQITNLDLYEYKFPINVLESNINSLDLRTLIKTQDLTYEFVINYVLNDDYQITPEEKTIDMYDVVYNQPHIDINELKKRLGRNK
jgi:hypothetical protein